MHTATVSLQALRAPTPEAQALAAMTAALRAGYALAVAYSGGKDSSVLANLALTAAVAVRQEGRRALLVITHTDVGAVENPEIRSLVRAELGRMRRFADARGADLRIRVAYPPQFDSFAVRVIGGRALPAFPDSRRDCTRLAAARVLASRERVSWLFRLSCITITLITNSRRSP